MVVANVRDNVFRIGNILSEYYGTPDSFVSASLCAYETFLGTASNCSQPRGQSFLEPFDVAKEFPFLKYDVGNASSLSQISIDDIVSAAVDAKGNAERWLDGDATDSVQDIVDASGAFIKGQTKCNADVLLCRKRKRSLVSAIVIVETYATVGFLSFQAIGINSLGLGLFISAHFTVIPSIVVNLAYDFPVSCFPKLPVCLGDDMFELLASIFPRHFIWPSQIVKPHRKSFPEFPWLIRLDRETHIEDCRKFGFTNIYDEYFYVRKKVEFKLLFEVLDWPLTRFSSVAHKTRQKWENTQLNTTIDQCGALNAVGFFPPVITSFFFYVILSYITVPVIRISMNILLSFSAHIKLYIFQAMLVYNQ